MMERMRQAASRILSRYGGAASLVRVTVTPPAQPWDDPVTVQTVLPVQFIETGATQDMVEREAILASDVIGIMEASEGIVPELTDTLALDGVPHLIVMIKPVRPAPDGPVVHYWLQARA